MNDHLTTLRKAEQRWRNSISLTDRQSFIKHRNHYGDIIKTKQEYYHKTIDTNKNDIKNYIIYFPIQLQR